MSGQYENAMDTLRELQRACEQCSPEAQVVSGVYARQVATAAAIARDFMRRATRAEAKVSSLEQAIRSHTVNLGDLADLLVDEH